MSDDEDYEYNYGNSDGEDPKDTTRSSSSDESSKEGESEDEDAGGQDETSVSMISMPLPLNNAFTGWCASHPAKSSTSMMCGRRCPRPCEEHKSPSFDKIEEPGPRTVMREIHQHATNQIIVVETTTFTLTKSSEVQAKALKEAQDRFCVLTRETAAQPQPMEALRQRVDQELKASLSIESALRNVALRSLLEAHTKKLQEEAAAQFKALEQAAASKKAAQDVHQSTASHLRKESCCFAHCTRCGQCNERTDYGTWAPPHCTKCQKLESDFSPTGISYFRVVTQSPKIYWPFLN